MFLDEFEREVGVARRLRQAALEIGHHVVVDEVVVGQHAGDALAMDGGREQFGERRGGGDDQRLLDHEAHIGFAGVARGRQRAVHALHVVAVEPQAVGQHQPALEPALLFGQHAVVIVDAMDPFAAQLAVVRAAHEGGVLARHGFLIAIAVERPGRDLALVELAAVQHLMERMEVVIAHGADSADLALRILPWTRGRRWTRCGARVRSWGRPPTRLCL